ncbi:hypothetical protein [Streptomyces sp. NPDC054834]
MLLLYRTVLDQDMVREIDVDRRTGHVNPASCADSPLWDGS